MEQSTETSGLQQLDAEHLRFLVNQTDSADTIEIYKEHLYKRGHTEDSMFFVQYMQQIRNAPELAEAFCKIHPNEIFYLTLLNDIRHKYFQYDKRNVDYAVYTPEVVLLVVLWSTL